MLHFKPNYLARIFRNAEPEVQVTITNPEPETPEVPVVVVAPESSAATIDPLIDIASRLGSIEERLNAMEVKTAETEQVAEGAIRVAETAIEVAAVAQVEAEIATEEVIGEISEIPAIEEIPPEVIREEMPEIEHRARRGGYFID